MRDFFTYNERCQDTLKKITDPLKCNFGIDNFWHIQITEEGYLSNTSNFHDQLSYFYESQWYNDAHFLVAPSCLTPGYFYLDFDTHFEKVIRNLEQKHPLHHPLIIIRKESASKAHIFGFASRQKLLTLPSFYSNNLPLLNSYLNYFLAETKKFKTLSEETSINLAELKGKNRYYNKSYGSNCLPNPESHAQFLQQIGVSPSLFTFAKTLSRREKEALLAACELKTAKEQAQSLGISYRTAEYHLENAKNKLAIFTKDKLVECARILQMVGLLA